VIELVETYLVPVIELVEIRSSAAETYPTR